MKDDPRTPSDARIRLNKYIADCGVASRRKADELITEGAVIVNGKKVYELGAKIDPNNDRVTVNGKPLKAVGNKIYLMFNKPRNIVTTLEDPEGRPTIGDFFKRLPVRVFPVGRLDWDTEGLILLTNDGEFSQAVMHPSKEVTKTYLAKVSGQPSQESLTRLLRGVSIVGGRVSAKSVERLRKGAGQYDWIKIVITEGKNRQVKQMFEKIGFDVMKLRRVAIGRLKLPASLERGQFMELGPADLDKIFVPDASVRFSETEKDAVEPRDEPRMASPHAPGSARGGVKGGKKTKTQRPPSGLSTSALARASQRTEARRAGRGGPKKPRVVETTMGFGDAAATSEKRPPKSVRDAARSAGRAGARSAGPGSARPAGRSGPPGRRQGGTPKTGGARRKSSR